MLREVRGISFKMFIEILHYLFQVPIFAFRSLWISRVTGVTIEQVSIESSDEGLDLLEAARRSRLIIVAAKICGVCCSSHGCFVQGDDSVIYDLDGPRAATAFNFQCSDCGAKCGTTTCALRLSPHSTVHCHVVSKHILISNTFLPLKKPHQRNDEYFGFSRALIEAFIDDAATQND